MISRMNVFVLETKNKIKCCFCKTIEPGYICIDNKHYRNKLIYSFCSIYCMSKKFNERSLYYKWNNDKLYRVNKPINCYSCRDSFEDGYIKVYNEIIKDPVRCYCESCCI